MKPAVLLVWGLTACGGDAETPAAQTTFSTLHDVFDTGFFDATARAARMSPEAAADLRLPGLLDASRYSFLHVGELRRVSNTRREGDVAFAIDGWPAALDIELERGKAGWRVVKVGRPEDQQALVDLLGPDGLASAPAALPWNGGLAGRDAAGRPTAAVMLLAVRDRIWVDGRPVGQNARAPVVAALRAALGARQQLAQDAHATYRPQVAIALPRDASSLRHALLAQWAVEAGAVALGLVVRTKGAGPGYLPLARRGPAPLGVTEPDVLRMRRDLTGVHFSVGETKQSVAAADLADKASIGRALEAIRRAQAPAGAVIEAYADGDHGGVVALLDSCRASAPDLAVAPAAP